MIAAGGEGGVEGYGGPIGGGRGSFTQARMMTRDGIVGYCVPKPGFNIPAPPPVTGKGIGYLTRPLRRRFLKAIIANKFTVSNPADCVAELHLGGQAICKLVRPAMTVFES